MKKSLATLLFMMLNIALFSACNSNVDDEDDVKANSGSLSVSTRTPNANEKVSYPLVIYVFNGSKCCAKELVQSENENFAIALPAGNYSVYTIGGVSSEDYALPTKEDATTESLLKKSDDTQPHGDLMVACNKNIGIVAGKSQALDLKMERKVMQLDKIEMKNIPNEAEKVTVTISALYNGIHIDGSYSEEKTSTYNIELTKQEDGTTWKTTPNACLLPSDETSIQVELKIGETTKSFSYSGKDKFVANSHFSITATYQAQKLEMKFTGAVWGEDKEIDFNLVDNDNTGGTTGTQSFKVGEFYNGCYIFEVDETNRIAKVISAIEKVPSSSKDIEQLTNAEITEILNAELSSWTTGNITNWRVMNVDEAKIIHDNYSAINTALSNQSMTSFSKDTYYVNDNQEYRKCNLSATTFKVVSFPQKTTILRPIAEINF